MKNEKGFGVVEGLLILVIVGLIGGVGYYVYKQKDNTVNNAKQSAASQNNQVSAATKCGSDWTTINTEDVVFPEWNVKFEINDDLVGKAVCRKDPDQNPQYFISTKDVTEKKCYEHLTQLSLADPVVSIWRYDDDSQALDESGNSKYYNVGNAFFYQTGSEIFDHVGQDIDKFTAGNQPFKINKNELKTNCPNVKAGYIKQFGNIASKLETN